MCQMSRSVCGSNAFAARRHGHGFKTAARSVHRAQCMRSAVTTKRGKVLGPKAIAIGKSPTSPPRGIGDGGAGHRQGARRADHASCRAGGVGMTGLARVDGEGGGSVGAGSAPHRGLRCWFQLVVRVVEIARHFSDVFVAPGQRRLALPVAHLGQKTGPVTHLLLFAPMQHGGMATGAVGGV